MLHLQVPVLGPGKSCIGAASGRRVLMGQMGQGRKAGAESQQAVTQEDVTKRGKEDEPRSRKNDNEQGAAAGPGTLPSR